MFKIRLKNKSILMLTLFLFANILWAQKGEKTSLAEASEMVREQTKGKILSARSTQFKGLKTHRIQVLTPQGRIKIYQIPLEKNQKKINRPGNRQHSSQQSQPRYQEQRKPTNNSNRQSRPSRSSSSRSSSRGQNNRQTPRNNSSRSQLKPSNLNDRGKQHR